MLQRRVCLARVHIVQHRMAVRKRSALGVLAGEPDRDALDEQGREGQRFGLAPVDPALLERCASALELALQLRMDRELFGDS